MAPSRKVTNGRSPLVNKQYQITSFFTKADSSLPKSKPQLSPPKSNQTPFPKSQNPNPNPNISPGSSPPTTPSPINAKSKSKSTPKPLLVIGSQKSTPTGVNLKGNLFGEEVVNRRIRVYWPIDEAWYEGCVKSFDKVSGKHLVEYDDNEEEMIDLSKEEVEWIEVEGGSSVKKSRKRRLRKVSIVVDDEEEEEGEGNVGLVEDDSSDEDWGKNVVVEEEDCLEEMDLVDEEEEKEVGSLKRKKREVGGSGAKKGKEGSGEAAKSIKKKKVEVCVFGSKPAKPVANVQEAKSHNVVDSTTTDALERFGIREEQKFPFLGKDRQDAKRRRPGDTDYDPRTLYLPPQFLKNLTGGQRQWWEFKSKHMDKVLFFKMGKFYEIFEMDAHIGVKELDLQYMRGEQPHCGFPEKNFSINVEKLARKGYRVLVVEQTETPDQLDMRRKEEGSKDKVVKREICAVVTKGTLTEGEMLSANPEASYIMSVNESCSLSSNKEERLYGVCVVDVTTSQVIIGQIKDDLECSTLCSLLSELRPVEIIKPAKMLSPETERALTRYTRNPLINELLPNEEFWDADRTVREVKRFYSCINISPVPSQQKEVADVISSSINDESCWLPKLISELLSAESDGSLALSALGGTLYYLKQAFLDENLLRYAKFESLPCSDYCNVFKKPYMVLDAAALENLEIFENSKNGGSSGTLYSQLNYCVTGFGKRLLKTWLARPLYHAESIRERQDAIAGLRGNISLALEFRKELSKLPDMERLLMRLFASSEANGRNASKIVLYEDAAKKQLQEFISALRACEVMIVACSSLGSILDKTDSKLLHHLLVPGKGLPNMSSIIKEFRDAFDWVDANSTGRIIPLEGADAEFDSASKKIEEIESDLKRHIVEQKKLLGITSITYVTIGKDIYLLEVPERLSGSVPRDYELRSSKKGFSRYWTPFIKKMVGELTQLQAVKESKLKCMLQDLVGRFCEHHTMWRSLVSAVAELDVLITLVIASDYYEGPTCRPSISSGININEVPQLAAKSLGHPIIKSDSLGRGTFVPNDINIGGSDHATFILLTGPNMGGKSTLLRQICLAVILAQVGANVPAEHFELSLVDRIFVRMGAKDHIMAGQSTFLTELSETASMLTSATRDSLVALDELGRGTSTSDGQAIAESVLEHFVRKVQCRGMFSTHYHRLAIDYKRDPKVSLCHMACQVGKGDRGLEEVTFLYRLTPGACPKSYGVNVARLAGIPVGVLFKAAAKSKDFEAVYGRHQERSNNNVPDWNEKTIIFFQNLIGISSSDDSANSRIATLSQLQHQARILLEQN
ncbi:DNA mismatch repair protein MSH6-like isoform X2 [Chenopodium quinoa]|uniref:DNA mismatch repair protein MSH6-like isoform X2 n=1 Tax=Chenopodium quinoa TaxID=63459 RepID=UPI000B77C71E|nr:DNA mismatch repair protein MSH6-like isoform X2 [Chenopodium quinoa]